MTSVPAVPKVIFVMTAPQMTIFLCGQLCYLRKSGMEVVLCCPVSPMAISTAEKEGVSFIPIELSRSIAPINDCRSILKLRTIIKEVGADFIITGGPKAGLVGMVAAFLCRTRIKIHVHHGIRLETAGGALRVLLWITEKIGAFCADRILCVSQSIMTRLEEMNIASVCKMRLIANGSANGVDSEKFCLSSNLLHEARHALDSLGIPVGAPVLGFMGRLNRDKGIAEMALTFKRVKTVIPDARLVLVGENEANGGAADSLSELMAMPGVHCVGHTDAPQAWLAAFDVLLFPSHREGFGMVVVEAAACGTPTVGFNVTGVRDSVVNGVTGTIVPYKDTPALAKAAIAYLQNDDLRKSHGVAGRARVVRCFQPPMVWQSYVQNLAELANERGLAWTPVASVLELTPVHLMTDSMNFPWQWQERERVIHGR